MARIRIPIAVQKRIRAHFILIQMICVKNNAYNKIEAYETYAV